VPGNVLIVEGTAAVGKTTLCSKLVRTIASRDPIPSLFHFRQAFTYHPLNPDHPDNQPNDAATKVHLSGLLNRIRDLAARPGYVILETLHWSLSLRPGIKDAAWYAEYEAALRVLGAKTLLVVADESRHYSQLMARRDTEFFSTYGRRYGGTTEEVISYYIREQATFTEIADRSTIRTMTLDSSSEGALEQALGLWEE
jgi:hypothetical protein